MKIVRATAPFNGQTKDRLTIGIAQIAPVWFQRTETLVLTGNSWDGTE